MLEVCFYASRDNLLEELLREPDEVATKRKRTRDTLKVLEQAFRVSNIFSSANSNSLLRSKRRIPWQWKELYLKLPLSRLDATSKNL